MKKTACTMSGTVGTAGYLQQPARFPGGVEVPFHGAVSLAFVKETLADKGLRYWAIQTHGVYSPGSPLDGVLQFKDGYLTEQDAHNIRYNCPPVRLVILGGCSSEELQDELVRDVGVAVSAPHGATHSSMYQVNRWLDAAINEPDKPLIALWHEVVNPHGTQYEVWGNKKTTARMVFAKTTLNEVRHEIAQYFKGKESIHAALSSIEDYFSKEKK